MENSVEMRPATRDLILKAALVCLERKGVDSTRVEEVLREACVSRGTFYRYFRNMDEVVVELLAGATREMLEAAIDATHELQRTIPARLAAVIARVAGRETDPPIVRLVDGARFMRFSNLVMDSASAMGTLSAPLLPLLEAGRSNASLRSDLTLAMMVEWLTRNTSSIRTRRPPWVRTMAEFESYISSFVLPGLLAPVHVDPTFISAKLVNLERSLELLARGIPVPSAGDATLAAD